ncbi:TPA: hypothetical protein ACP2PY_002359 [Escherichia coli]|uniref:hypothetical protein n=1 Tax=Escherichia coli TaxID=562 RepID=UPI0019AF926F|nr:hypothetical protein [Escherichia coli]UKK36166.1 hypothetical protein GVI60_06600 [Citrobacter freundii]EFO2517155.1 hypothetical protein [Escherichia coli]EFO2522495.1 hypothetical protein [Escherichia coli]EFO2550969.1 hypothetical protein [Escherichia coli]EFO2697376.1 hypothetical protein [Escherichia coli]
MGKNENIIVEDVLHQDYGPEDGIPPHWCCKFYRDGFADYEYFSTKGEAYDFAFKHGYKPF